MTSSQVPCPSPNESHATCTPDTTWPVSRHPPYSSWEGFASPVLMSPVPFDASSVVHVRSSLSSTHDVFISRLLTVTFTTAAFRTEAAYGCLKPAPTSRLRRAYLHLRHSTVPLGTFMAQQTLEIFDIPLHPRLGRNAAHSSLGHSRKDPFSGMLLSLYHGKPRIAGYLKTPVIHHLRESRPRWPAQRQNSWREA